MKAKRREHIGRKDEQPVAPVEVTAPAAIGAYGEAEQPADFTIGSWRGFTQWRCAHCPFDTLESEEAMRRHLQQHAPPAPRVVRLDLLDHKGEQIRVLVQDGEVPTGRGDVEPTKQSEEG